jgi:hypothetical protein
MYLSRVVYDALAMDRRGTPPSTSRRATSSQMQTVRTTGESARLDPRSHARRDGCSDLSRSCRRRRLRIDFEEFADSTRAIEQTLDARTRRRRRRRGPSRPRCRRRAVHRYLRPEIRRDYPLNLSILISGGKETNQDSLSNGE